MGSPISLRDDFDAEVLRGLAKASGDANQTRRLLALAVIYDGGTRSDAARIGALACIALTLLAIGFAVHFAVSGDHFP